MKQEKRTEYLNRMRKTKPYRTGKRAAVLDKMAAMRAAKERKRLAGGPREEEPRRVPAGELLGVLQWAAACGEVKRIVVRQGERANQIRVAGCRRDHGFDWLMRQLRGKLSVKRLRFGEEVERITGEPGRTRANPGGRGESG